MDDELKRIEFEIEKVKASLMSWQKTVKILRIDATKADERTDELLTRLSKLLKQRDKLKE